MLVLLFEKHILPGNTQLMQYALISFMIIPVIYITVLLKKTSASYISCVVFMSVTVSHGADVNPYLFAINRMIDTLIGIAAVSYTHLDVYKRQRVYLCEFIAEYFKTLAVHVSHSSNGDCNHLCSTVL